MNSINRTTGTAIQVSTTSSESMEDIDNDYHYVKQTDQRSSMTILVLGDARVGKSSLIRRYTERCFREDVPGLLSTIRIPQSETILGSYEISVKDTQRGDISLLQAVATKTNKISNVLLFPAEIPSALTSLIMSVQEELDSVGKAGESLWNESKDLSMMSVDSIILVYDSNRSETLERLETHWLPLIEYCFNGKIPVVIAENKIDLLQQQRARSDVIAERTTNDQKFSRKTNHIMISLMQRFNFIRQQFTCSAVSGHAVDDVFKQAERHVFLFTFQRALCNIETGTLSQECERAISRIFRIFDVDHDNLLSDSEFIRFKQETFNDDVFGSDLLQLKLLLQNYSLIKPTIGEPSLQDDKFTVAGFKRMFDFLCIEQNKLDVVWQVFRRYGYDDELNLSIRNPSSNTFLECWKLSSSAEKFLKNVFRQFDSDDDGILSPEDIRSIFSVLPPPALPPWHPQRAIYLFGNCFSRPKQQISLDDHISAFDSVQSDTSPSGVDSDNNNIADSPLIVPEASISNQHPGSHFSLTHTELSLLSASDTLPSIDVGGMSPVSQSLSFHDWMGHWHALATISESITKSELYRLGFDKEYSSRWKDENIRMPHKRSSIKKSDFWLPPSQSDYSANVLTPLSIDETSMKSRVVRVLVLGKSSCGKTSLLDLLCRDKENKNETSPNTDNSLSSQGLDTVPTKHPETRASSIKMSNPDACRSTNRCNANKTEKGGKEFVVHIVFTDIPESVLKIKEAEFSKFLATSVLTPRRNSVADVVLFVVDTTDIPSFDFVKEWESKILLDDIPRLFVCTKFDEIGATQKSQETMNSMYKKVENHCEALDLEPPVLITACNVSELLNLNLESSQRHNILRHISRCALCGKVGIDGLRSRPHEEQKRKDSARRRTMMWFGGIAALAVAVGVGLLWGSNEKHKKQSSNNSGASGSVMVGGLTWLKKIFTYSRPSSLSSS